MTAGQPGEPGAPDGATGLFARQYGEEPRAAWHAPGRVNLIGEHTDYNDGFVLPFAIGAGVTVAAARRDDGALVLASRQADGADAQVELDGLAPGAVTGWAAYPAGVAWALRDAGYQIGGASLAIDSDLPLGAGLSSSAALECAVALALTELHGLSVPRPQLAALARRAENEFVGAPTGIMDQSAALLCQAGHALLLDCRSGIGTAVPLDPGAAGLSLLVIDTRARHAHVDGGYAARRQACEDAAAALGVRSLRDITDSSELAGLDPVLRRRARHVVTENSRVLATAALLRDGELARTGPLLTASHASLRDDFEVSWPEANATVEAAVEAGACGARMTGGGFGGSVVVLVPAESDLRVRAAVAARFTREGWPAPSCTVVAPSAGARRVR
ncbi:MAG TPA: galactokinase [Streptosporangiaceae bacterium]|nr:galactokinase [Streptosporangiaceae bacterium]